MSPGRLLVGALLVAPVASCAGSVLVVLAEAARNPGEYGGSTHAFALVLLGLYGLVLTLPALLLVGVPLALVLKRGRVRPPLRDALLLAAGLGAAWPLAHASPVAAPDLAFGLAFGLATAGCWAAALHWLDRAGPEAPR